jgi:diguanylate cyclase (GGDEF)-like protein
MLSAPEQNEDSTAEQQRIVLLVESSTSQRILAAHHLAQLGYRVEEASNGDEASAKISEISPDVVLLAWELPGRNGLEVLAAWQSKDATRDLPVLIVTSHSDPVRITRALDGGAVDFVRKPFEPIELDARIRAALRVNDLQTELREFATRDPLTGLLNRRAFSEIFTRELDRCRRYGNQLSICLVDIDHFKSFNDTYGHDVGDEVLVGIADAFQEGVRGADCVARWGGEEFVLLLVETGEPGALLTLNRLRETVAASSFVASRPEVRVNFSGGLASIEDPTRSLDLDVVLKSTDDALYRAKEEGRNRIVVAGGHGLAGRGSGPCASQKHFHIDPTNL